MKILFAFFIQKYYLYLIDFIKSSRDVAEFLLHHPILCYPRQSAAFQLLFQIRHNSMRSEVIEYMHANWRRHEDL